MVGIESQPCAQLAIHQRSRQRNYSNEHPVEIEQVFAAYYDGARIPSC